MMLFGIDTALLAAKAFTMAAMTVCPVRDAPQVEIYFAAEKPYVNETFASSALRKSMMGDKDSTVHTDKRDVLLGVTTSKIDEDVSLSFRSVEDRSSGQICLYINRLQMRIIYYPAIFIAKEVKGLPCKQKVVRDHEDQHVVIDVKTLQEYLPKIKMEMLLYLRSVGYQGIGPFSKHEAPAKAKELIQQVVAASQPMIDKMRESRRQRQGIIDTPDNYARETEKCPEEQNLLRHRVMGR